MPTQRTEFTELVDPPIPVRAKLAAAWTSFMFLYIYVDYLHLYKPGAVSDILAGVVWEFDISETFAVAALASVAIPIFMIVLSMTAPASRNRITNLVIAGLYIPYSMFNIVGESWMTFYGLGVVLELILLGIILRCAWTWPRSATARTPDAAAQLIPTLNP